MDRDIFNNIKKKELFGSRLRCLLLTGLLKTEFTKVCNELVQPYAIVDPDKDKWMPIGIPTPGEARLDKVKFFDVLTFQRRKELRTWWLKIPKGANTPNWDIVSSCIIEKQPGLLLFEAKAHVNEASEEGKDVDSNPENHKRIRDAIQEARDGLNPILPGWKIDRDSHYQLSNRIAWTWKLATMKIPVVLIYLGFLNASEMKKGDSIFEKPEDWETCLRMHARGIVPDSVWETRIDVNGTPIWLLIRSLDLCFKTPNNK